MKSLFDILTLKPKIKCIHTPADICSIVFEIAFNDLDINIQETSYLIFVSKERYSDARAVLAGMLALYDLDIFNTLNETLKVQSFDDADYMVVYNKKLNILWINPGA